MSKYYGGSPSYYDHIQIDPRIKAYYSGGSGFVPSYGQTKYYQRRRRCGLCGQLVGIRTSMHEGMLCDSCREKVQDKPLSTVTEVRGGIGFVRWEYAEEGNLTWKP